MDSKRTKNLIWSPKIKKKPPMNQLKCKNDRQLVLRGFRRNPCNDAYGGAASLD